MKVKIGEKQFDIRLIEKTEEKIKVKIGAKTQTVEYILLSQHQFLLKSGDQLFRVFVAADSKGYYLSVNGQYMKIEKAEETAGAATDRGSSKDVHLTDNQIKAPMPGKILKIFVKEGQQVPANARLFILEAMKMENEVVAPHDGKILKILSSENEMVSVGEPIIEMEFNGKFRQKDRSPSSGE